MMPPQTISQRSVQVQALRPLAPRRCLMLGRTGVGKSTIIEWLTQFIRHRGIVNNEMMRRVLRHRARTIDPPEVLRHEILFDANLLRAIEQHLHHPAHQSIIENLGAEGILFHIWDFGGQLPLLEQARQKAPRHIFRAADLMIWVIDSRRPSHLRASHREFTEFRRLCPNARIAIFLNKWDFEEFQEDGIVLHMDERVSVNDVVRLFGVDRTNVFTTSVPRWETLVSTFYELATRLLTPPDPRDFRFAPYDASKETPRVAPVAVSDWDYMATRIRSTLEEVLQHTAMRCGGIADPLSEDLLVTTGISKDDFEKMLDPLQQAVRGILEVQSLLNGHRGSTSSPNQPHKPLAVSQVHAIDGRGAHLVVQHLYNINSGTSLVSMLQGPVADTGVNAPQLNIHLDALSNAVMRIFPTSGVDSRSEVL